MDQDVYFNYRICNINGTLRTIQIFRDNTHPKIKLRLNFSKECKIDNETLEENHSFTDVKYWLIHHDLKNRKINIYRINYDEGIIYNKLEKLHLRILKSYKDGSFRFIDRILNNNGNIIKINIHSSVLFCIKTEGPNVKESRLIVSPKNEIFRGKIIKNEG